MIERTGGCHCGAVRFKAVGEPMAVNHCHCLDCQRVSGAPFVTWATFRTSDVTFTAGGPRRYASSAKVERAFCAHCGSPFMWQGKTKPENTDLTVASFDSPGEFRPADHIWTERQQPWIKLADGLPRYRRFRGETPV
jgi:hypothetical protein